jgi:hypothetical protein
MDANRASCRSGSDKGPKGARRYAGLSSSSNDFGRRKMGMPFNDAESKFKDAARHARLEGNNALKEIAEGLEQLTIALMAETKALHEKLGDLEEKL